MGENKSTYDRLYEEYKCLCLLSQGDVYDRLKMAELTGKITFAAEYKHITPEQWETLFSKIYKTVYGE